MGLLRRPTTSEIVEDGRLGRPYGPGAHSRAFRKTGCRLAAFSPFHRAVSCLLPSRYRRPAMTWPVRLDLVGVEADDDVDWLVAWEPDGQGGSIPRSLLPAHRRGARTAPT